MFVTALYLPSSGGELRMLAMGRSLPDCLRRANAVLAEDPALLTALYSGAILVTEGFHDCGTYDQMRSTVAAQAREVYNATRLTTTGVATSAGGPGDESPAGPPASGDSGDQGASA